MAGLTAAVVAAMLGRVAGDKTLTYWTGAVLPHFRYFAALARRRAGASLARGGFNLPKNYAD